MALKMLQNSLFFPDDPMLSKNLDNCSKMEKAQSFHFANGMSFKPNSANRIFLLPKGNSEFTLVLF